MKQIMPCEGISMKNLNKYNLGYLHSPSKEMYPSWDTLRCESTAILAGDDFLNFRAFSVKKYDLL